MKRKGKGKPLTRSQRARQEKGLERAEAVMDQMKNKVEKGSKRQRTVKERAVSLPGLSLEPLLTDAECVG